MSSDIAVRPLGEKEPRITTYASYDEMVDSLRQEINTTEKLILRVRWFVGCQAYIITEGKKYGDHSVEEFAAALGLSPSSIYEARKFYLTYTKEELDQRLIERQVSYRRALAMSRCQDAERRALLEDAAYEYQLSDDEVDALIRIVNGGGTLPSDPACFKEFLENLQAMDRTKEEMGIAEVEGDSPLMPVPADREPLDEDDAYEDPEDDEDMVNKAVADPNGDRRVLREIRMSCGTAEEALTKVIAALRDAEGHIQHIGGLGPDAYANAEKAYITLGRQGQETLLALYSFNKALTMANIVLRK